MEHQLNPYQHEFLYSKKRYPAIISGVGTGKTEMLLMKIYAYCEAYPDSLALVIRKEFTDLRDSTLKDFSTYFGKGVDSNKEYHFANGSVIMFRHGGELSATNRANVLKNINLSIFGIEQAEEFDTDEIFTFLRDRLRRQNAPLRQGLIIANANGHNWCWRLWKNNPTEQYDLQEATTFDNAHNLPADFIEDLKRMEIDSPNHYRRYVMNSHEETDSDDLLLSYSTVYNSPKLVFNEQGTQRIILGADIARFGDDETIFTILKSKNINHWEQIFQESHKHWDLMQTTGRILDLKREFRPDIVAVDDTGVGGGVTDRLRELKNPIKAFVSAEKAINKLYSNRRTEGFFYLKELLEKGYLKLMNDNMLLEQLLTLKFKYKSNGQKALISKDEMRKENIKSPDRADALMIAAYYTKVAFNRAMLDNEYLPRTSESTAPVMA